MKPNCLNMASKFYTICDKKIEEECQALLYEFKEELKLFLSLFMDFMEYCAGAIEDLWVLATRLLTITKYVTYKHAGMINSHYYINLQCLPRYSLLSTADDRGSEGRNYL